MISGKDGVVKFGGTQIPDGLVQSWNLDPQAETVSGWGMGSDWKTTNATVKSFSGSVEFYWDPADAVGASVNAGDTITLDLYPGGEGSGKTYFSGSGVVTGVPKQSSKGDYVSVTVNFEGSGALSEATVV